MDYAKSIDRLSFLLKGIRSEEVEGGTASRIQDSIGKEAEAAREVAYAGRLLVQATLPHSKPADGVTEFERSNGNLSMKIIADASCGLPYGTYPRMILALVVTEAVRTKSPDIELGDTFRQFMNKLSLSPRGGARGNIGRLRDHMRRLFSATVSATYRRDDNWQTLGFRPIEKASMFWNPKRPEEISVWHSEISLNQRFFEEIVYRPVPIDMHALCMLTKSRSPMAIDIYQWLTHRFSYLKEATLIPWALLQLQFGGDYGRTRDFRVKFLRQLKEVLSLYPQANVEATEGGLMLRPSKTHVTMRLIQGSKRRR